MDFYQIDEEYNKFLRKQILKRWHERGNTMEICCSTSGIVDRIRPKQGIGDLCNAGFDKILLDLNLYCDVENVIPGAEAGKTIKFEPELMRQYAAQMSEVCKDKKVRAMAAIAPYLPRDTRRTDLNELLLRIGKDSIRYCEGLGCSDIVIRPLFAGVEAGQEWEVNRSYYLELAEVCQKKETKILLQNQCRDLNGRLVRGICSDGRTAAQWIENLNMEAGMERFAFCMDVGICNICGQNMQEMALTLGEHLKMVILRDNDGQHDYSMLPFTSISGWQSSTDWLSLLRGLREIRFDGQLILDMADTRRCFSPLLRPQLLVLAKSVVDYFKWQIEIEAALKKYKSVVLFGAGNMCRNFMKCYGDKYTPLFTCDNNSALWGSKFCGLEVKSPEALRKLPEDCGVFICNIYYREIEQQLRELGVTKIEFFNDEYMPSFHFDRIERR